MWDPETNDNHGNIKAKQTPLIKSQKTRSITNPRVKSGPRKDKVLMLCWLYPLHYMNCRQGNNFDFTQVSSALKWKQKQKQTNNRKIVERKKNSIPVHTNNCFKWVKMWCGTIYAIVYFGRLIQLGQIESFGYLWRVCETNDSRNWYTKNSESGKQSRSETCWTRSEQIVSLSTVSPGHKR